MNRLSHSLFILFLLQPLAADELQWSLLDQLDQGLQFMAGPNLSCQVTLESQFHMENPNGRKPMDHYELYLLTGHPGSEWEYEMLASQVEGEENLPHDEESQESDQENQNESITMTIPVLEYRDHFSYSLNTRESRLYFEPLEEYRSERGYSSGYLQYDKENGHLLQIQASCITPPRRVDWMEYQMDFQYWGGSIVPKEMTVKGEGGFLMIRKVFETRLYWSEYQLLEE